MRSGSAKACHTRSRGASKTRMMTSSCVLFCASTLLLLGLDGLQIHLEAIEAFFPEAAVVLDPLRRIFQRPGFQPRRAPLRLAAAGDQPRALQHFQMLGNRGGAYTEGLCQFADGCLAEREPGEDRASCRIGEGGKGGAEMIGHV